MNTTTKVAVSAAVLAVGGMLAGAGVANAAGSDAEPKESATSSTASTSIRGDGSVVTDGDIDSGATAEAGAVSPETQAQLDALHGGNPDGGLLVRIDADGAVTSSPLAPGSHTSTDTAPATRP